MKEKGQKLSVALLIFLVAMPQVSETIYTPALPNVAHGLNTSDSLAEATLAIYFIGFALGVLLWGTISDRTGRRSAMVSGMLIYIVATLACGFSTTITALLGWRFLQAFGISVGSVITQTIMRDSYEGTERTKLFALICGATAFSPALGPIMGGVISEWWGWRANFLLLAFVALILIFWTFRALPETRPVDCRPSSMKQINSLLRAMTSSSALWGHALLIGATNSILFGFYQEAPFIFIEQLKMQPSHYGCFGLLIASTSLLSARFCYRYSTKFAPENLISVGAILVLIGSLLMTLSAATGLFDSIATAIPCAIFTLFLIFFGVGLVIPNSLSQALKPYNLAAGTAGSIFGGGYYCFIALCTWSMSEIHNGTALPLPLYMTAMGLVLTVASLMVRQPNAVLQAQQQI